MKRVLRFVALFILLIPLISAKTEPQDKLQEYLEVLKASEAYKSFEGGYQDLAYDRDGYLWSFDINDKKLNRFNGNSWRNMGSFIPAKDRDRIQSWCFSTDDHLHLWAGDGLYRWQGHGFIKYKCVDQDILTHVQSSGDKMLALSKQGYYVLEKGLWHYHENSLKDDYSTLQAIRIGTGIVVELSEKGMSLDENNSLYQFEYNYTQVWGFQGITTQCDSDFYIYRHSANRIDSILVIPQTDLAKYHRNVLPYMEMGSGHLLIGFNKSDRLYRVDLASSTSSVLELPDEWKAYDIAWDAARNQWQIIAAQGKKFAILKYDSGADKLISIIPVDLPLEISAYDAVMLLMRDGCRQVRIKPQVLSLDPSAEKTVIVRYNYNELNVIDDADLKEIGSNGSATSSDAGKDFVAYVIHNANSTTTVAVYKPILGWRHVTIPQAIRNGSVLLNPAGNQLWVYDPIDRGIKLWSASLEAKVEKLSVVPDMGTNWYDYWRIHQTPTRKQMYMEFITDSSRFLARQGSDGKISEIKRLKDIEHIGLDAPQEKYYYYQGLSNMKRIYSLDLKSGQTKDIGDVDKKTKIKLWNSKLFTYSGTNYSIYDEDKLFADGMFGFLRATLEPILAQTDLDFDSFMEQFGFTVLTRDSFLAYRQRINLSPTLSSLGTLKLSDLPDSIRIVRTKDAHYIDIPTFVFHESQRNEFHPNIYSYYSLESGAYAAHIEKQGKEVSLRISKFDGKLQLSPDDLMIPIQDDKIPNVSLTELSKGFVVRVDDKQVHYFYGQKWHNPELKDFDNLGYMRNIESMGSDLWFGFQKGIVKHSLLSGLSFPYTQKDGLPTSIRNMWVFNNELYLRDETHLYRINETSSRVRINLPWLQAGTSRYAPQGRIRLKHDQNNLLIPVDILDEFNPDKCVLEYKMLNYDLDWRRRPYIEDLEYNQMKPGRYFFEIKAYTPDGWVSKPATLIIQIMPPLHATWWAYLIYIALGACCLWLLYKLRIRQLQARTLFLESLVQARTLALQEKTQKVTESIQYASLIQKSILPQTTDLSRVFQQSFVIWKPRDIVGGDFYWLHELPGPGEILFAVIDCTGHGVPGALISMSVNSLLNTLVMDRGLDNPAEILTQLHRETGALLHQEAERTQQDGFEIALIRIDTQARSLVFSGAGLSLLMLEPDGGEPELIHGDRHGIGGLKWRKDLSFTEQSRTYMPSTRIYLYTDGILDQPHPHKARKLRMGIQHWLEFIAEISDGELPVQETLINEQLDSLLNYHEQRDDITIIGLMP